MGSASFIMFCRGGRKANDGREGKREAETAKIWSTPCLKMDLFHLTWKYFKSALQFWFIILKEEHFIWFTGGWWQNVLLLLLQTPFHSALFLLSVAHVAPELLFFIFLDWIPASTLALGFSFHSCGTFDTFLRISAIPFFSLYLNRVA